MQTTVDDDDDTQQTMTTTTRIQRYKISLQYVGTSFSGWQRQSETSNTIQQVLEDAIANYVESTTKTKPNSIIQVFGSSRTDAGVHAIHSTAHFDLTSEHVKRSFPDSTNLLRAFSSMLYGKPLQVISVEQVSQLYNARRNAKSRTYTYKIFIIPNSHLCVQLPLLTDRAWFLNVADFLRKNLSKERRRQLDVNSATLDLSLLKLAANEMIGTKDFTSFCSPSHKRSHEKKKKTERTIHDISIVEYKPLSVQVGGEMFGNPMFDEISITMNSKSFLYHQCRYMVHAMVSVACSVMTMDELRQLFEKREMPRGDRKMVPAQGLYLTRVHE